jgi:hypothetical protein
VNLEGRELNFAADGVSAKLDSTLDLWMLARILAEKPAARGL